MTKRSPHPAASLYRVVTRSVRDRRKGKGKQYGVVLFLHWAGHSFVLVLVVFPRVLGCTVRSAQVWVSTYDVMGNREALSYEHRVGSPPG